MGASVNMKNKVCACLCALGTPALIPLTGGWTALHLAAKHNQLAFIDKLVFHGAKIDVKTDTVSLQPYFFTRPPCFSPSAPLSAPPSLPAHANAAASRLTSAVTLSPPLSRTDAPMPFISHPARTRFSSPSHSCLSALPPTPALPPPRPVPHAASTTSLMVCRVRHRCTWRLLRTMRLRSSASWISARTP
eukprot:scaffold14634_cov112-Isochrysis_galbana.AAC.4